MVHKSRLPLAPLCRFFVGDRYTVFHRHPQLVSAERKLSCAPFSQEFWETKFFAVQCCLVDSTGSVY